MAGTGRKILNKLGNIVSGVKKNVKGDNYTGIGGIPLEASQGMAAQDARDAQYAATHQGEVVSGKIDKNGKTGSNPSGKVDPVKIVNNVADAVDTIRTGYSTGKTFTEVENEKREKEKAEKEVNKNNNTSTNNSTGGNNKVATVNDFREKESEEEKKETEIPETKVDYDRLARNTAKAHGLDKLVDEEGNVDYKRANRQKVGFGILNALAGAAAGLGAGLAGKNAPDMSKGMLGQEMQKRQDVIDAKINASSDETSDERQIDTLTKSLKLNNAANKDLQKTLMRYNTNERQAIVKYIQSLPADQRQLATKVMAGTNTSAVEDLINTVSEKLGKPLVNTVTEKGGELLGSMFN